MRDSAHEIVYENSLIPLKLDHVHDWTTFDIFVWEVLCYIIYLDNETTSIWNRI